MGQLLWMLSLIPDSVLLWFINIILIVGLAGTFSSFFLKFIPPAIPYATTIKYVGIALLVIGVWFRGGYDVEMQWRDKLRVAEEKARIAEEESKEANTKLDAAIKQKTKVVKENTIVYRDRIKEVAVIMDKECKVVPEAIEIHNAAAKNKTLEKK